MSLEVLKATLAHLSHWYDQDGIEEIAINKPGQVCIRLSGKREYPWVFHDDKYLSRDYLSDLMYIIANTYEIPYDPLLGSPLVFASIPGEHRFTGIAGRNVMYNNDDLQGGIAICIRKRQKDVSFDFEDYGLEKGKSLVKVEKTKIESIKDPYEKLMTIIKNGEALLISGATATGKTTFLNNLIQVLDQQTRVITVEDARELVVPQENHVHITLSRTEQSNTFNYKNVIDLMVRMTPDIILAGEISTENAGAIWELMGTGHENFLASIHAESPKGAYKSFIDRISHTYPHIDQQKTLKQMKDKLHVVQISREGNLRTVTEIT